jgi:hypothetical protein
MKKILFLVLFTSCLSLTACGTNKNTKKDYTEDNINTPFLEIRNSYKEKVETAFKSKAISRTQKYAEKDFALSEREKSDIGWQEDRTKGNKNQNHFWFTCYYFSEDVIIVHVERSDKGIEGHKIAISGSEYYLGDYYFHVYGPALENYAYIIVYKDGNLYELDNAYENGIIDDNIAKDAYKHYMDSKFLKYGPYNNPYQKTTTQ